MSESANVSPAQPLTYTAVLTAGEEGWFLAQVPEVPEAIRIRTGRCACPITRWWSSSPW